MDSNGPTLKRALDLKLLTLYGLGTIVGGGFYALVGKVAASAGMYAPVSWLVAIVVAAFSALSFGELSARYPASAGESRYVFEAFGSRGFSILVGWMVIATGVVSAATLANAFVGFLGDLVDVSRAGGIAATVLILGAIAAWGIGESVAVAILITFVEIGGLLFVFACSGGALAQLPARLPELVPPASWDVWPGILSGGFLCFYAYLGFEDMVNMAEEVKEPERTLPRAIVYSLALTGALYLVITTVAALAKPPEALAASNTPLALLVEDRGRAAVVAITFVSMFAGINGALVQLIMGARVAYGMSAKGMGPKLLAEVHPKTRTPLAATALVTGVCLVLAWWFPLVPLARMTSFIILLVYAAVNLALIVIKRRAPRPPEGAPRLPVWVPAAGLVLSLTFVGVQAASWLR
jgi:amino acid transporter